MIGIDIVAVERIERFVERFGKRGLRRFLSEEEIQTAKNPASIAGLWAAKEAVSKALGCGIGKELGFHDIIIRKSDKGAPFFILSEEAKKRFSFTQSGLSISHDGGFAIAVAVIL